MPFGGKDIDHFICNLIHETVFLINPPGPAAGKLIQQLEELVKDCLISSLLVCGNIFFGLVGKIQLISHFTNPKTL